MNDATNKEEIILPQMKTKNRRAVDEEGECYTDSYWHPSKSISISNILGFLTLSIAAYFAYDASMNEMHIVLSENNKNIAVLEKGLTTRIDNVEANLKSSTSDRIRGATVLEMFKIRDIQIQNLAEKMSAMEVRQGETNRLLTDIYREMPKASKN